MYQARCQGVKITPLCSAVLGAFGVDLSYRDESLPGHLKSGHDKVPGDIVTTVRNCDLDSAVDKFAQNAMPMFKASLRLPLLQALITVLNEDQNIGAATPIGLYPGYTKQAVLSATSINFPYFITSLIRFAVLETDNQECADAIKSIPKTFVSSFSNVVSSITIDDADIILKFGAETIQRTSKHTYITAKEIQEDIDALVERLGKYKKPDRLPVPIKIASVETTYVTATCAAYASAEGVPTYTRTDVERNKRYREDLAYHRKCFYATETIRRSLQDALLPIEYKEFEEFKDEIEEGIFPVYNPPYTNGYKRLMAVAAQASNLHVNRSLIAMLPGWIGAAEKVGMCHMLVNDGRLEWVHEDDGTV